MNYALLLTSCVSPSLHHVHRSDPTLRENDYAEALEHYLRDPDPRVRRLVFVENSGYPLDRFIALVKEMNPHGKEVEFLSVAPTPPPHGVHYGYSELEMIDIAMKESRLLQDCDAFIKASGRLRFPTLSRLLDRLPAHRLFAVDCRRNSLFVPYRQEFVTTQLMIFGRQFYLEHLNGCREEMDASTSHIEKLLYYKLQNFEGRPEAVMRWPVNADPVGQAGHWNKHYNSPKRRLINAVRGVSRVILPKWWV